MKTTLTIDYIERNAQTELNATICTFISVTFEELNRELAHLIALITLHLMGNSDWIPTNQPTG